MGKYIGEISALGKGYATEASIRWLKFAFQDLDANLIYAITRKDNISNIKVNRKLGLNINPWPSTLKPISQDWIFMSLTREQWSKLSHSTDLAP